MIIKDDKIEMNINYSVIIPYHNIPDLLTVCLNSIPVRDDVEIIVVDDHSDDKFDNTDTKHAHNPNYHYIYTTEGKRAGYARNVGIEHANGKWLLFADSDDYYDEKAFDYFDEYVNSNYDIVHFNQEGRFVGTDEFSDRCVIFTNLINKYAELPDQMESDDIRFLMPTPYVKMINHEMVKKHNVRYEEVVGSNDVMFSTKVGYYAKTIYVDNRTAYYVTTRKGSMTKTRSREDSYTRFCVWVRYNKMMKEIGKPERQVIILNRVLQAFVYFDLKEAIKYIKTAKEYNISIWTNAGHLFASVFHFFKTSTKKDKYLVKNK